MLFVASYYRMSSNTDQYYIDRVRDGDREAYGVLVDRYQDLVYTLAYRVLKVREEAQEVAQDSFLKAFDSLDSFRGESKFATWIYRITYRKAIDRLRKLKRHQTLELIEEITENRVEDIENALHFMMQQERKSAIRESIAKLPPLDATLVTLYYFQDLSVREIAGITELSEDNVKVKLFRIRKKLYTLLEQFVLPQKNERNGKAI